MKLEKNWFYSLCITLSVMGMIYIVVSGISGIGENKEYPYIMKGILLLAFFLVWRGVQLVAMLFAKLRTAEKLAEKRKLSIALEVIYVVLVISAAFVLRFAVIMNLPMQPESDYKTYYEIADMLKNGTLLDNGEGYCNYIAMFPHVIGYAYILKNVFVLFGTSIFNGQSANIIFSVATVFLIYRIGRKLGGRLAGLLALTAAAFWPSQILYVNMLSAEYVFSFFLYLSVLLFLHLVMDYDGTTKKAVWGIFLHIILGCLLAVTAAIRPMALTLLAAILICIIPLKMKIPNIPRNSISIWVRFLEKGWLRGVLILTAYITLSGIITTNIELTINKTVPSFSESFGYNLLVGLNTNSKGGWNEEDSKLLYDSLDSTGSPVQAQIISRDLAFERLTSDPKAIFNLLINKYELLWGNDDYGATWNLVFLNEQKELTADRSDFLYRMQDINNIIYISFVMFSIMSLIYLLQRKASYTYVLILLYLGTVGLHLFVESQNRYHFHVLQVIMIMASIGISYIFENAREQVNTSSALKKERSRLLSMEEEELRKFAEEEHLAIENRYKEMTNVFDMESAVNNGNVIVTVSEKYKEDFREETDDWTTMTDQDYEVLEEIAAAGEQDSGTDIPQDNTGSEEEPAKVSLKPNSSPAEMTVLLDKIEQLEKNQKELRKGYIRLQSELMKTKSLQVHNYKTVNNKNTTARKTDRQKGKGSNDILKLFKKRKHKNRGHLETAKGNHNIWRGK